MRTFLLDDDEASLPSGGRFEPGEERARYLTKVLRLRAGAVFPGTDRRGRRYLITMEKEEPCSLLLLPAEEADADDLERHFRELPAEAPEAPRIVLLQALLKGKKMDQVVRQATEAGAARIVPVVSERSIVRVERGEEEKKRERWLAVAREAVQQSGAAGEPAIGRPVALKQALAEGFSGLEEGGKEAVKLFFHERPLAQQSLHDYLSGRIGGIVIAVGPEGGFSPDELSGFAAAGFKPAFLAGNILRAETAAIYALAAVKTIAAERETWRLAE